MEWLTSFLADLVVVILAKGVEAWTPRIVRWLLSMLPATCRKISASDLARNGKAILTIPQEFSVNSVNSRRLLAFGAPPDRCRWNWIIKRPPGISVEDIWG